MGWKVLWLSDLGTWREWFSSRPFIPMGMHKIHLIGWFCMIRWLTSSNGSNCWHSLVWQSNNGFLVGIPWLSCYPNWRCMHYILRKMDKQHKCSFFFFFHGGQVSSVIYITHRNPMATCQLCCVFYHHCNGLYMLGPVRRSTSWNTVVWL